MTRTEIWGHIKEKAVEAAAALARELEKYRLFTDVPHVGSISVVATVMWPGGLPVGYIEFGLYGQVFPGPYFRFFLAEQGDWSKAASQYYSADNLEQLRERVQWFLDPEWIEEKAKEISADIRFGRSRKDWYPAPPGS